MATGTIAVNANAAQAYTYFVGQGYTPAQASGIVGNLMQESNVNPNEPGGGIAQWINNRWTDLVAFANNLGQPVNSLTTQLAFIMHELSGPESAAGGGLKNTTTPADAAVTFQNLYERCNPAQCNQTARVANANAVYQQMTGKNPPPGSGSTAGSANTSTASSSQQNCTSNAGGTCDCQIGWTWPSTPSIPLIGSAGGGNVCLWYAGWSRAALGGLCLLGGGILVLGGAALLFTGNARQAIVSIGGSVGKGISGVQSGATRVQGQRQLNREGRLLDFSALKFPERPANRKGRNLTTGRFTLKGELE